MAHVITIEVGEGTTHDCTVCPFQVEDVDDWSKCGLPESFPDCDDVDYQRLAVRKIDKSN